MKQKLMVLIFGTVGLWVLLGCGESTPPPSSTPAGMPSRHGHVHYPPHGGTPVVLGQEEFHLEILHVPQTATLRCYVLDGHMDGFVRVATPSIPLTVTRPGDERPLIVTLQAVAMEATGETVGDTSQFETQGDWLEDYPLKFEGLIPTITIRGVPYTNVSFSFPWAEY